MSLDNYNDYERELSEQRRKRADEFRLNISDSNFDDISYDNSDSGPSELNSYSGQDVREQMARDSRHALKQKKRMQNKERKAKNKHNRRIFRICWIASVVIVGAMLSLYIITGMNDLLAINRTDPSTVKIDIPENPDLDTVSEILLTNGAISEPSYFKMFASVTKAGDDFSQGTYEIRKNMDYEAIINFLTSSGNRTDTVSVTITEGENVLEVVQTLKKNGALSDADSDKFLELCNSDEFDADFDFIKSIDNKDKRYYKLEGYLYPDTYEFYKNEEPSTIIYKFLNNFETKINEKQSVEGYSKKTSVKDLVKKSDTGYTLDRVMALASIIQAEAANEEDMFYISSILHNRLNSDVDMGVSALSLDSTRFYPYRSAEALPDDKKDFVSSYDTYENTGLPPGPICNPGMTAIIAALNPNDTGYYYFCHDSGGQAYYAATLYEQEANLEYIDSYDN